MHKLLFALYATLLAGTHMADFNMPHSPPEAKALIIPIQGWYSYGYRPGYYHRGGGGWQGYGDGSGYMGPRGYGMGYPNYQRDMTPDQYYQGSQDRYYGRYNGGYSPYGWRGW
jgi:hypothetical protein